MARALVTRCWKHTCCSPASAQELTHSAACAASSLSLPLLQQVLQDLLLPNWTDPCATYSRTYS